MLKWETNKEYHTEEAQILWKDPLYTKPKPCLIWIQERPHYCDRGRYVVMTDAPLDHQEGWPRYYFDLNVAKTEIDRWVAGRSEIPK